MGPNISEKFVPGGTNFRGVQIKRDIARPSPAPVFDCLWYAKVEREDLAVLVKCDDVG